MSGYKIVTLSFLALGVSAGTALAQAQQEVPESNVMIRSVNAVGYRVGGWSTKVDLKSTVFDAVRPPSRISNRLVSKPTGKRRMIAIRDTWSR